ncbi:MAG: CPBP family intramembrane metalloprotease [Verrucomicrobia bacterium]|nr:CPBP family intramembrane metalloprotease [Verrucomicrobiota bacterium]MCG2680456.1 CPBP family intramembrane metalloprotease [Kiritimatiellia bacterium]MBU4247545.1 CPBP family intramembrane metalloprotease [Verrucomicrobiota bacterium]MBU4291267.1 CPBP family intramembrane metalloprotease [Verrucomicrobiota bacterium]MBU4428981.1 CPBP family intramembrane metalloprotease [Verrucomicrobiota bacterium]
MHFIAEISNQFPSLSNLPFGFEDTPNLWILGAGYMLFLLAGCAIDIILGVRLLVARCRAEREAGAPWAHFVDWARSVDCLKGRSWTWREAGWIAIVLLTAHLAVMGIHWILVAWGGVSMNTDMVAALCQGMWFHMVGLAALTWSIRRRRLSWHDAFGMRWREAVRRTGQGIIGYLGILPLVFVTSLVYQVVLFWFGYPLSIQNVVLLFLEPQTVGVQIFLIILAIVIAPLVEEALFRGVALPLLARTAGVLPAMVLTAACFALIHFHVPSIAPLFVLAMGFAAAYIITKSLWVPVVMHALFNGMNIGLLLLARGH